MSSIDIELFTNSPDRGFKELGTVNAKVVATTNFSKTPTIEDVNLKLQEEASRLGANGVINVTYDRGISLTSWRALRATGTAVVFESDTRPCPVCAETIKQAAQKCRFCGTDLTS